MICVTIARPTHTEMIAEMRRLAAEGAKFVELRVDFLAEPIDVARLLADRPCEVLVTCRRPADGGKFAGPESERLAVLQAAIAAGAEYVDLEEDAARQLARSGRTKRVVSFHNFEKTPADLEGIYRRLAACDADFAKIAVMATCTHDNRRMLDQVRAASPVPLVGFCMGELGVVSRLLSGKFGAPFTYAAPDADAVAPGQVPFRKMVDLYRYDQIHAGTEVFGVIADPVGHSLSPLIHNTAFAHLNMNNRVYVPLRVPPCDLAQFMLDAPAMGIRGLSITIPHKETVIPSLGEAEESVRVIGAANTAVWSDSKKHWCGYNTDFLAAMGSLEEAMAATVPGSEPLAGKTALLLGAGGVGKALAFGLTQRKANVVLCDGERDRATALAARFGCRAIDWAERHTIACDVLVNGTPLGMHPKVDQTPYDAAFLKPGMVVFDAVYNPEFTMLLQGARARGCTVVSGVDMFVRQACLQFQFFTGQNGPAPVMKKVIQAAFGQK